jgi:glycyl-tRNA synthetase
MPMEDIFSKIVSLAKRRGFVYPTSEIYGGLANAYDYGPMGVELLRNIKNLWWSEFIHKREDMVGLDSSIILHPQTWVSSGHVGSFSDPLVEDVKTHKRYRADHLIEKHLSKNSDIVVENMTMTDMAQYIKDHNIKSPEGNELTEPKAFNLLFESHIGAVSGEKSTVYLRGETAQGIFTNFGQITDSTRVKLPFGVGQIGKSFRNEITTGQFIFRTYEFEQAEIEYFFNPEKTAWEPLMESWKNAMFTFVHEKLGIKKENLQWRRHTDKERSHYSKDTYDLDYQFPFGWKELWGIAYRTDYDLKAHNVSYKDPQTNETFVPHVMEPAVGINRLALIVLCDAYHEEEGRIVLKLDPKIAPYKVAVFPLVANKENVVEKARNVANALRDEGIAVAWDERGNIGKRYLAQDEIGTPACVTIDYQTLEDDTVTIRDRDTKEQIRITIHDIKEKITR